MTLPACSACGRLELPPESDQPPSLALRDVLVELLRFADEFDGMDTAEYTAVDFVDWMALNVGTRLGQQRPDHQENRRSGQRRRQNFALAG